MPSYTPAHLKEKRIILKGICSQGWPIIVISCNLYILLTPAPLLTSNWSFQISEWEWEAGNIIILKKYILTQQNSPIFS